ncbi:MAG: ATPase [Methanomicrobiales archaeon HGW-Methanomicrobiales-1]|jgi:magnesium-transporting ATPase (P-type)|nr:MAG: ATPase [Methanomicrobiales archaeon HGW-Methanomicrobiales-1]
MTGSTAPAIAPGAWHTLPTDEVLKEFSVSEAGLSDAEAALRRKRYGKNTLPVKSPPGLAWIFLVQFKSPLIFVLLIAAVISAGIGDVKDAAFIFLVLLINAVIGAFQEYRAEQGAQALKSILHGSARVVRGGKERTIISDEVVPGDIVHLDAGSHVPADLRILHTAGLTIDESILTGESVAVEKRVGILELATPLAEQRNMAFAGTTVMTGIAVGMVTATGSGTEVGKIARSVSMTAVTKPPLIIRMERFSLRIGIAVLIASTVMAIIILSRGVPWIDVFFFAVALAISAIPEGLPVSITVALSIAASRLADRHVIVRHLAAVEGLGSCTVIATDKTGTLTLNQQTARIITLPSGEFYHVTGSGYTGEGQVLTRTNILPDDREKTRIIRLATSAVLASEGSLFPENEEWIHSGDTMDVAVLALTYKLGLDPDELRCCSIDERRIPFDSRWRYSAAFFPAEDGTRVAVKGGMEVILNHCRFMLTDEGEVPLDRVVVEAQVHELAHAGYRILVVADGIAPGVQDTPSSDDPIHSNLTLLGLVGFIDPVRPEVTESIQQCRHAGVEVVMITGDQPATAMSIARTLSIADDESQLMTGTELAAKATSDTGNLPEAIANIRVFARVTPEQKFFIVDALQKNGHYVAVTGDGVNDAPALRRANIGVAMGSGSDVAKDTASIILTDDNFTSIVAGIEEGRFAYDNIRKVTYLLISTGFAEVLLFTLSLVIGLPLPLLAVQLLWLNLVTNGIQDVTLAFEKGEDGAMKRKPRPPEEGIFNRLMVKETLLSASAIGLIAFGTWYWLLSSGWDETSARNLVILLMVLLENVHVFNCRSEYQSAFKIPFRANLLLIMGVIAAQGIHILSMYNPVMQDLLQIGPVSFEQWGILLGISCLILVVMELFKFVGKFRNNEPNVVS